MPGGKRPAAARRRIQLIIAMMLAAAVLVGAGWVLAVFFQSPAQVAVNSEPPPPSEIVAEVTLGTLSNDLSLSATASRQHRERLSLGTDGSAVLTKMPVQPGGVVSAGSLVAEISGSPLFALPGEFPFYRELAEGDSGPDVRMLQDGLREAGYDIVADGVLGGQTLRAVASLHADYGYPTPVVQTQPEQQEGDGPTKALPRTLPIGSFLVVGGLPAVVVEAPSVGAQPEKGFALTLATGDLVLVAQVSVGTAQTLRTGMKGRFVLGEGGDRLATLKEIPEQPGEGGVVPVVFEPEVALPPDADGAETVLSVEVDPGVEEALIVPTVAVIVRGESMVVRRRDGPGEFTEIRVQELAQSAGRSALRVIDAEALTAGDEVWVGP